MYIYTEYLMNENTAFEDTLSVCRRLEGMEQTEMFLISLFIL